MNIVIEQIRRDIGGKGEILQVDELFEERRRTDGKRSRSTEEWRWGLEEWERKKSQQWERFDRTEKSGINSTVEKDRDVMKGGMGREENR